MDDLRVVMMLNAKQRAKLRLLLTDKLLHLVELADTASEQWQREHWRKNAAELKELAEIVEEAMDLALERKEEIA